MTENEIRVSCERLLVEYGDRIFNTIYYMLGNFQEAEDVFQETFCLAISNGHTFRGDSQPGTWLYRIAMNAVKTHIKRNSRHMRLVSEAELSVQESLAVNGSNNGVESRYFSRETNSRIHEAMRALPIEFREVFVLNCVDGYSYKEIAGIVGVPIGTVESRLFRAKDQLRRELSDLK